MKQLSLLIKPASSLCNMACTYCFYADVSANRELPSMGIMKEETVKALIDKTLGTPVSQVNYCFQGGEPTMAGIQYFIDFINYVNENNTNKKITYAIQTNGLTLDKEWVKLFKENHFLVGVSLDGFIQNHDYFRKDRLKKGTFRRIMQNIKLLEKEKIDYNILTVLTHELSKKPEQLFKFYQEHHLKYVQLIPCLPSLEKNQFTDKFALTPRDFSTFYKTFFDLWFKEYLKGNYISVTLFDNVIPMYLRVPPNQCGMLGKCQMQIVVEGNGNVYPCDFYVLDKYLCGNIKENNLEEIISHINAKRFLVEERTFCKECETCPFYKMCYGNCKRLSACYYDEYYCGYKDFLEYSKERMYLIAKKL